MKTYRWQGLNDRERDEIVANAMSDLVGPFSTSLDACFALAKEKGIPLNVFRDKEGRVWAGVHTDDDYGEVPVAHGVCHALLKSVGFTHAEPCKI